MSPQRVLELGVDSPALARLRGGRGDRSLGPERVVLAADPEAEAILSVEADAQLLFFSEDDYRREVEGLAPAEVDEVIALRRRLFDPVEQGLNLLWLDQRTALSWAALAGTRDARVYFEEALERLAWLAWAERLRGLPPRMLLRNLVERNSALVEELRAEGELEEAELQRSWASSLAERLREAGFAAYASALPRITPSRVALLADDEVTRRHLAVSGEPCILWQGSLVATRPLPAIREAGATVLWGDPKMMSALGMLATEAQRQRELTARRLLAGRDPRAPGREYLNESRLGMATMRIGAAATRQGELGSLLSAPRAEESSRLFAKLARDPIGVTADRDLPELRMRQAHQTAVEDAAFVFRLFQCRADSDLVALAAQALALFMPKGAH